MHEINIDQNNREQEEVDKTNMSRFLVEKRFNDIWTFNSVLSRLVCLDLMTLNQVFSSQSIRQLLSNEFKMKITSLKHIKNVILDHYGEIVSILKKQIQNAKASGRTFTISFDEW